MPTTYDLANINEADFPPLDLRGEEYVEDHRGVLARTLQQGPIARSRRGVELLSYELISDAFLHEQLDTAGPEHYAKLGAQEQLLWWVDNGLLSTMPRHRHDPIRRLLLRAFSFRNIEDQRKRARAVAEELLADWIDAGRVDLIAEFTEYYPIRVMADMIGIPRADIAEFSTAAHELHLLAAVPMAPHFPRIEVALTELRSYVGGLLDERRREPQDDFISAFLASQEVDGKLSEDELVGNLVNLVFAGMGTTTTQLASAVNDIVEADRWERLYEHPEELQSTINECLRFTPVTQFVVRIAQSDTDLAGYAVPKGTRILLNLLAASRDPEKFPNPDSFDISRVNDESRLPFGWGVHRCLGQPLARLLIEEGLALLGEKLTDVRIVQRVQGPHPAEMLSGPASLTIEYEQR